MSILEEWIKASYKVVENRPEPYGVFHLTFAALSLLLIVLVCYFARNSSDRVFRIVLFSVGTALLLSEVYKQLYYLYADGSEGYDWYIFPFQLCSVPMYLSVFAGCLKKGAVRDAVCEYLASIGFLGGIMAYLEPSGILKPTYFTLIHSCLWHALLIFLAMYILFTGNACRRPKDYQRALPVLGGVVLTATTLNILFRNKPDFNMCYISPFYGTPLAVFKSFDSVFEEALGVFPGRIVSIGVYLLALVLGGLLVYLASYFIQRLAARRTE